MKFSIKKHLPKIIFFIILAISITLFYTLRLNRFFTYENVSVVKEFIVGLSFLGPIVLYLLYIIFNLICMPTLFFNFLAGYLYGPYIGFAIAWTGMIIGLMSSFINVRYIFRDDFQKRFCKNIVVREIEYYTKKYHVWTVIFFRIFFIFPYNFQNVAYGLSTIRPLSYFIGSTLGIIPITALHVFVGYLIDQSMMDAKDMGTLFMYLGIFIGVFASVLFTSIIIKRKLNKTKIDNTKQGDDTNIS